MNSTSDFPWQKKKLNYYRLNCFYELQFGERTWKVSIDAGCSCPNQKKPVALAPIGISADSLSDQRGALPSGCIFCDSVAFSPSRRMDAGGIFDQIEAGIAQLNRRYKAKQFIAYFQPSTNTYGDLAHLRTLWETALKHPKIVGLIIGTRPDCVGEPVLSVLKEMAEEKWVSLELGVQSLHDSTLQLINRGHDSACALDAIARCKAEIGTDNQTKSKLHLGVHVILGLPGETPEMMNQTAEKLAQTPIDSVKIHNIYVTRNTVLEQWYNSGRFIPPTCPQYVQWVVDFIERMPPRVVIDRISGSVPTPYLAAPDWCSDSSGILKQVESEFIRRSTVQGSRYRN